MMRSLVAGLVLLFCGPAHGILGGQPAQAPFMVMITSTRGAACSASVMAPDILLTAAHCVAPDASYAALVFEKDQPVLIPVTRRSIHPEFQMSMYQRRTPTPDLALVRLGSPLPARFGRIELSSFSGFLPKGSKVRVLGHGLTREGDPSSAGQLHETTLAVLGSTSTSQMRLHDPSVARDKNGAGACHLDSGGAALVDGHLAGVIIWANGHGTSGCGWLTGIVLTGFYDDWIKHSLQKLTSE